MLVTVFSILTGSVLAARQPVSEKAQVARSHALSPSAWPRASWAIWERFTSTKPPARLGRLGKGKLVELEPCPFSLRERK